MTRVSTIMIVAFISAGAVLRPGMSAAATSSLNAEVEAGKAFAEMACAACHQVRPDQPSPPPVIDKESHSTVEAPSFIRIAYERGDQPAYLREVITRPTHPMPEQLLEDKDVAALVAYIRSLRATRRTKP